MSNNGRGWHPENDGWNNDNQQGNQDGPSFGYFGRPNPNEPSGDHQQGEGYPGQQSGYPNQPGGGYPGQQGGYPNQQGGYYSNGPFGDQSAYGQFGESSGQYQHAPYGGYDKSPFPLHPLSPMEQIDAAIRLVRYNPKTLIILPLIVYLVVGVLSVIVVLIGGESIMTIDPLDLEDTTMSTAFVVTSMLTSLISFIAGLFIYTTAVNAAMSAIYGRKISMGQAISMSTGDSGRLFLAYIVYALMFLAVAFVLGFALFPLMAEIGSGGIVLLSLALLVVSVYFGVRVSCTIPVLVAEQRGPIASIGRSFQLTKGRFWPIFATLLASFVILIVVSIVVSIIIVVFSFLAMGTTTGVLIYSTITNALMSALLVAFTQAVTNVIYINLRMVRENFHYEVRGH